MSTMTKCCIPDCCAALDDSAVTFHKFPSSPDKAAKWIQNINLFIKNGGTWFPQPNAVVCSAHFIPADFNQTKKMKTLKSKSVPTIFVRRIVPGRIQKPKVTPTQKSPMIVKVLTPESSKKKISSDDESEDSLTSSSSFPSQSKQFQISKVVSLSGMNIPSNNTVFSPSVILPPNFAPVNFNNTVINSVGVSQNLVNEKGGGVFSNQVGTAQLLGKDVILVPHNGPPPPLLTSGGYILVPSGTPVPPPGSKIIVPAQNALNPLRQNMMFIPQPAFVPATDKTNPILIPNDNLSSNKIVTSSQGNSKKDVAPQNLVQSLREKLNATVENQSLLFSQMNKVTHDTNSDKKKASFDMEENCEDSLMPNDSSAIPEESLEGRASPKSPLGLIRDHNALLQKFGKKTASAQSIQQSTSEELQISPSKRKYLKNYHHVKAEESCSKKRKRFSIKKQAADVIEISPSTFLKINPDVITVSEKETPNGNTVLQFTMNPHLLGPDSSKPLFALMKDSLPSNKQVTSVQTCESSVSSTKSNVVQSNDVCISNEAITMTSNDLVSGPDSAACKLNLNLTNDKQIRALIPADLPVVNRFSNAKVKYAETLRMKTKQLWRANNKIKVLEKKLEELENRCIVQERQLNFASLKKLKLIKKDAEKGVPHAAFILEQIRSYFQKNRLNWSRTTLIQSSIWCRKAPYAYEYFKKANLFRLPALTTVKRFMQRNPEVKHQIKNKTIGRTTDDDDDDDSSSDFGFDDSDDENIPPPQGNMNEIDNAHENTVIMPQELGEDSQSSNAISLETFNENPVENHAKSEDDDSESILPNIETSPHQEKLEEGSDSGVNSTQAVVELRKPHLTNIFGKVLSEMGERTKRNEEDDLVSQSTSSSRVTPPPEENMEVETVSSTSKGPELIATEDNKFYIQTSACEGVTTINIDGQEIVIPPGTIVQLNSEMIGEDGLESHYLIIPSSNERINLEDHQYSFQLKSDDVQEDVSEETIHETIVDSHTD